MYGRAYQWMHKRRQQPARRERVEHMDRRGRIRLSTMEIVLIGALIGSLLLGLLQARQEERRQIEDNETAGEHQ